MTRKRIRNSPAKPAFEKPSEYERHMALTDAERTAELAQYDRVIPPSETRPLTAAERRSWRKTQAELQAGQSAPKKRGRPKVGQGTTSVLVSVEKGLLRDVDAYAKSHNLKRTQLVAAGLRLAMAQGVSE